MGVEFMPVNRCFSFFTATRTAFITLLELLLVSFLGVFVTTMSGCVPETPRITLPPDDSLQDVAVLIREFETPIVLFSIDGVEGPEDSGPPFDNRKCYGTPSGESLVLELKPGKHILEVGYRKFSAWPRLPNRYSPYSRNIEITVEAGKKYRIVSEVLGESWGVKVIDFEREKARE